MYRVRAFCFVFVFIFSLAHLRSLFSMCVCFFLFFFFFFFFFFIPRAVCRLGLQSNHLPREYVRQRFQFEVSRGSLKLTDSLNDGGRPLTVASYEGFRLTLDRRDSSSSFQFQVDQVDVRDYQTAETKFPHLIAPAGTSNKYNLTSGALPPFVSSSSSSSSAVSSTSSAGKAKGKEEERTGIDPFFRFIFDIDPLDSIADYALKVNMKPLNIILSTPFIDRLVDFFRPKKQLLVLAEVGSAASARCVWCVWFLFMRCLSVVFFFPCLCSFFSRVCFLFGVFLCSCVCVCVRVCVFLLLSFFLSFFRTGNSMCAYACMCVCCAYDKVERFLVC
jgi:VPS13, central RBG modules